MTIRVCFFIAFFSASVQAAPLLKPGAIARPAAPATVKTKGPKDSQLVKIVKLMTQADQIHREAFWVLTGERHPLSRSPFGKVQRAAQNALDGKLSNKGFFDCDAYILKKQQDKPWTGTFAEKCREKMPEMDIATWTMKGPSEADIEFVPSHLQEVLGLSASIFLKTLRCHLSWNSTDLIEKMSCPDWQQDKGTQVLKLSTFEYQREGKQLIKLKGQILENLAPLKKIETEVPMDGKIVVTETELPKPQMTTTTTTAPLPAGKLKPGENKRKAGKGVKPPPVTTTAPAEDIQYGPDGQPLPKGYIPGLPIEMTPDGPVQYVPEGYPVPEGYVPPNQQPQDQEEQPTSPPTADPDYIPGTTR